MYQVKLQSFVKESCDPTGNNRNPNYQHNSLFCIGKLILISIKTEPMFTLRRKRDSESTLSRIQVRLINNIIYISTLYSFITLCPLIVQNQRFFDHSKKLSNNFHFLSLNSGKIPYTRTE